MSQQQVKKFLNDLNDKEELKQQLDDVLDIAPGEKVQSEEQAKKILNRITTFAENQGYQFSADEYKSTIAKWKKAQNDKLSDEELKQIAGGTSRPYLDFPGPMI